jgi:hypothetical protein
MHGVPFRRLTVTRNWLECIARELVSVHIGHEVGRRRITVEHLKCMKELLEVLGRARLE